MKTPCHSGGTCFEDQRGDYSCNCLPGYTGTHCETKMGERLCKDNPCRNDAICIESNNDYKCECKPGWTGKNCDVNFNECHSNPCKNSGTCIDGINNYTCKCEKTGLVILYIHFPLFIFSLWKLYIFAKYFIICEERAINYIL